MSTTMDPTGKRRLVSLCFPWCLAFVFLFFGVGSGCQCGAGPTTEEGSQQEGKGDVEKITDAKADAGPADRDEPGAEKTVSPDGSEVSPDDAGAQDSTEPDGAEPNGEPPADGGGGDGSVGDVGPDFQGPSFHFRVTAKTEDTVPPKLVSFAFAKSKITAGEVLEFSIEVGNDLSNVVSAQVSMKGPAPGQSMYIDTLYHPSKKLFVGRHPTSVYTAEGDWVIDRVYLQDGARNPAVFPGDAAPLKGLKVTIDKATPDTKGPTASAFALDATTVKAGEALGYTLSASDDVSGITGVEVTAAVAGGGAQVRGEAVYHPVKKAYVGLLRIPADGPDGKWEIQQISLRDNAGNFASIFNTDPLIKGKEFTVSDASAPPPKDTTKPVLRSAFLAPLIVPTGQQIRLIADADDVGSGVRFMEAKISDPTGAIKFQFNLFMNGASGLWEGTGLVPLFSRIGVWRVQEIQIRDAAGNVTSVPTQDLQQNTPYTTSQRRGDLRKHLIVDVSPVPGPKDEAGPLIKGFHMSPGTVQAGEAVRIFTQLEEPGDSGISSASCTFDGPQPGRRPRVILAYNSDTGFYEGNLEFSKADPGGSWWVSGCFLTDNAGNQTSVAGWLLTKLPPLDISRATSNPAKDPFVVELTNTPTPPSDTTAPVMKAIQTVPDTIKAGETIRIFVSMTDAGGVASGRCTYQAVAGLGLGFDRVTSEQVQLAHNPATDLWEGTLQIPKEAVPGEWVVSLCEWFDRAGNKARIQGDAFDAITVLALTHVSPAPTGKGISFTVNPAGPPSSDTTPPTLEKIAIAPANAQAGETVRVFAQLKEPDPGQVLSAFCSIKPSIFEPPRSSYGAAHLSWNPATSLWEGHYQIPAAARAGTWSLSGCQLEDVSRNASKPGPASIRQIPALDLTPVLGRQIQKRTSFTIKASGTPDTTQPTAKDFKWLPNAQAKAGEALLLQTDATDMGGSEVIRVEVVVQSPSGKFQVRRSLAYNPATSRWEASVAFPLEGEDGKWTLSRVDVLDFAGNTKTYLGGQAPLTGLEVDVSGSQPSQDKLPPVVKRVTRSKGVVVAGTSFRVAAELTDDASGIANASLSFSSPSAKYSATAYLAFNANTKLWEGEVNIPKTSEDGIWKPSFMRVQDGAGRSTQLNAQDTLFSGVVVTVRGAVAPNDTEPPKIQSLEISPAQLSPGEPIRIVVEATDDKAGIASVNVQLEDAGQSRRIFVSLRYDPVTKRYVATHKMSETSTAGVWSVTQIELVDRAGNRATITKNDPFLP